MTIIKFCFAQAKEDWITETIEATSEAMVEEDSNDEELLDHEKADMLVRPTRLGKRGIRSIARRLSRCIHPTVGTLITDWKERE